MQTERHMGKAAGEGGRKTGAGTPRWAKILGIIGLLFLALVAVLHLTGHGMGAHHHGMPMP